ncbi:MAG TPA: CBS domain-containing protein [Methanocorpusculum sp.]|nr:CBS domain-containing protein [Methanocorpusculum sp.]
MIKHVITIPDDCKLYEVIRRFKEEHVGRIIVTKDGKAAGILTHSDIVRVFPSL